VSKPSRKKPEMEKVGELRLGPQKINPRARVHLWPMWSNVANVAECGQMWPMWPCGQSWRNTTREIFAIKGLRDLKLPHQYRGMIDYPMMHSLSAVVSLMDFPRLSVTTLLWPMWPMWPNVAECGQCGRMWPNVAKNVACAIVRALGFSGIFSIPRNSGFFQTAGRRRDGE
jgi:hypothetical protein